MIYLFFFMSQVLTIKLTESATIFYISDRVVCTIKRNIKETFLENNSFTRTLVREGWIPATLSPISETLRLMLSKVGIISFGNPS